MTAGCLPVQAVAEALGVSRDKVEQLLRDGELGRLNPRLFPGRILVPIAELDRFIADNTVRVSTPEESPHDPEASAPARRRRGARPRRPSGSEHPDPE